MLNQQPIATCWNFGDSRGTSLSLDEFLAQKEAAGVEFFAGKEPWLVGLHKLSWQTYFRVCTQEMDDLSQKAKGGSSSMVGWREISR